MTLRLLPLRLVFAGLAVTLVSGIAPAQAEPREMTHVDSLSATVDGESITVDGAASFVSVPEFTTDAINDKAIPGPGFYVPADNIGGADLSSLAVSRPEPFGDVLKFTVRIADPTNIPFPVDYRIYLYVEKDGRYEGTFVLFARRYDPVWSTVEGGNPIEPYFAVQSCDKHINVSTVYTFCTWTPHPSADTLVEGTMEGDVIEWEVPMSVLGAGGTPGGELVFGDVRSRAAVAGVSYCFVPVCVVYDVMYKPDNVWQVPEPSLELGIAPAGTAVDDVTFTTTGTVRPDGRFSGKVPAPSEPGEYVVVARACYGPDNCGVASTSITV